MSEEKKEQPKSQIPKFRTTPPFKLKDKRGRNHQVVKFKDQFGFTPETIIIEKVHGHSNTFILIAVLTEEEVARVDALMKKEELKIKENLDKLEVKGGENDGAKQEPASKS